MSAEHTDPVPGCVFCKICSHQDNTEILYEDENFVAFRDIRPAATHHYLICPKRHIETAKVLVADDAEIVERLVVIGRELLRQKGVSDSAVQSSDSRMGFHWPPFNGIRHLHLHVIHPVSRMGFLQRVFFRPDSFWFVSPSWVIKRLEKMRTEE